MHAFPLRRLKKLSLSSRFQKIDGMTLIEVLIAILLFAVFSGVFLMVTELMASLLPSNDQASDLDRSCNGPALEVSCINSAFDDIIPEYFEKAADIRSLVDAKCLAPSRFFPPGEEVGWPNSYDCIHIIPASREISDMAITGNDEPGLFLAEARVDNPGSRAFWQIPVQRLFCWPYYKCVDVVKE